MSTELRGLYVVLDPQVAGERDLRQVAAAALKGGAKLLQLRDKLSEKGRQLPLALALAAMCRDAGALFLVNDHADLALAAGAHGVHLGQQDLPVDAVRTFVPSDFIIGCSTNNPEEARQAEAARADYVSVGRLFPTGSKLNTRPATLDTLRAVRAAVSLPICAIGGINESNIDSVVAAGADMAAVIAAVVAAPDPEAAARRLAKSFG
jgi:thiamine-phosphate pyrophosphorylase